ncbi:hypothetical protein BE04_42445 [Sorangium cellulosum]|uniref:Uncharacterized protein n=1 Tax=Sorangium cellulosum TaxID=56 RepID=A0A150P051_SORCE|nr:hypothetical protein BE04_42445 [Sorangium cellulosum]
MDAVRPDEPTREIVELTGRQRLVVVRQPDGDVVRFLSPSGAITLSVSLTEDGPVLRFEGASLVLQAAGSLAIEAEQLQLHGRAGVSLSTDGDLTLQAAGDLHSEARIQNVTATLGDVNVRANDDVKLSGERVRVNC